jgi:hypothetical protein
MSVALVVKVALVMPQSACIVEPAGSAPRRPDLQDLKALNAQSTDPMLAFFRFLAGVLLLIAVIAAVDDGTRSVAAGAFVSTPLAEHWSKIAPGLLAATQSAVSRATHPLVWELGMRRVLLVPTWALFAVLGLLFAFAGRRRRRINVFVN